MIRINSIGIKLNFLMGMLLLLTSITISAIYYMVARSSLQKQLHEEHLPAITDNIQAILYKKILAPSEGLAMVVENPFFKNWIKTGESKESLPHIYGILKQASRQYETRGANFASWETKNYINYENGREELKKITAKDTWFPQFKESGKQVSIYIYINHEIYGSTAFINRRIDDKGKFLGLVSVALDLSDFVNRVTTMTVGEKGSTFMTDRNGLFQLHENKNYIHKKTLNDLKGWESHLGKLKRENEYAFIADGDEGGKSYVISRYIPELDWILFAQADEGELMNEIDNALISIMFISLALITFGGAAGAFFTSRTISRPINETVERLKDIATGEGDLTLRLPIKSKDEIGELAKWFNSFMEKLQEIVRDISGNAGDVDDSSTKLVSIASNMATGVRETSEHAGTVAVIPTSHKTPIFAIKPAIKGRSSTVCSLLHCKRQNQ